MILVYSKDNCMQCDATKIAFEDKGIEYKEIDLASVPEKLAEFKNKGFQSAPIVVTLNEIWSGFRPEKIAFL